MGFGTDFYFAVGNTAVSLVMLLIVIQFYRRMQREEATLWLKMAYFMVQSSVFVLLASLFFVVMAVGTERIVIESMSLIVSTLLIGASYMNWRFIDEAARGVEEVFE